MPTYTHRQVAIPALGRIWIAGALTEALRRDRTLLGAVQRELEDSPLGAGAIGGTTLPIDPSVAAAQLGFAEGPRNPIDAVGSRDYARVDVRVHAVRGPLVLEVNPNPDLSPGAGVHRAVERAGIGFPAFVRRVVEDARARGA